jgi:hypothetical protein
MPDFNPPDPHFLKRVPSSFAKQQLMKTIGAGEETEIKAFLLAKEAGK